MSDDMPDITRLEAGDDVRIKYRSQRSGNIVERDGEVAEVRGSSGDAPFVFVHDEKRGFFSHTYVGLAEGTTNKGNDAVVAISVTTEPEKLPDERPEVGESLVVKHKINQRSVLGIVEKVIRERGMALDRNEIL